MVRFEIAPLAILPKRPANERSSFLMRSPVTVWLPPSKVPENGHVSVPMGVQLP